MHGKSGNGGGGGGNTGGTAGDGGRISGTGTGARILVIEDDPSIALGIRMNLEAEGYRVVIAEDGEVGIREAQEGSFDLVLLDIMLPKQNGYEVLMALRNARVRTPVLVLSARSTEIDKVMGLELGAEDYVTKPFSVAELLARVRVALRRQKNVAAEPESVWRFGEIEVNANTREVTRAGQTMEITAKEFDVLMSLIHAKGRVLSRQQIFDMVWGPNHHGTPRTIDNFVAQLRSKLEKDPQNPSHLMTVRGVGYRFAT
jgi:two-component system, OmpR family, alkaline phosphatase synthesis response regulator PhoP